MVGIIYKFTILTNGRFYVGQHEDESVEQFLISKPSLYTCYWGSGSAIWAHVLKKHIDKYPSYWNKLVKREVLIVLHSYSPKSLNKMERYWIKKEKAHYSYNIGGCNFLWGEANGDDWVNAMKLPEIRAKVAAKNRISLKGKLSGYKHWNYGKKRPKEVREKISKAHMGKKISKEHLEALHSHIHLPKTEEHKRKIGDSQRGSKSVHFGKHLTEDHKRKMSISLKNRYKQSGCKHTGKKWITNGIENKWHDPKLPIPMGWKYGRTI